MPRIIRATCCLLVLHAATAIVSNGILSKEGTSSNSLLEPSKDETRVSNSSKAEGKASKRNLPSENSVQDRSAKGAQRREEERDIYEAQGSYEHPYYYHGGGHYGLHHHHVSYVNDEAVKGLLVPLAGIALLGAAAIAASNPVLLQIGVIGGGIGKKRRKRAIPRIEDLKVLEKFLEQIPKPQVLAEEKKLQANYLQCSGIENKKDRCFERVTCEVGKTKNSTSFEKQVLDIVISDIMKNEYLPTELKYRIHDAQKLGIQFGDCSKYFCRQIEPNYSY